MNGEMYPLHEMDQWITAIQNDDEEAIEEFRDTLQHLIKDAAPPLLLILARALQEAIEKLPGNGEEGPAEPGDDSD